MSPSSSNVEFALAYARSGRAVVPLYWPTDIEGVRGCSCRRPKCHSPAKHPITPHGILDATLDEKQIHEWWNSTPDAGPAPCMEHEIVLDVDPRNGGTENLAKLVAEYGPLPDTFTVKTGGGGQHFFFQLPPAGTTFGKNLAPGIDIITGKGKYVVGVGSLHMSGRRYEVERNDPLVPWPTWCTDVAGKASSVVSLALGDPRADALYQRLLVNPRTPLKPDQSLLDYVSAQLRHTKGEAKASAVKALLEGKPFAKRGERDNTLYSLASAATLYAMEAKLDVEPSEIVPLFTASLRAMDAEDQDPSNPPPDEDVLLDKLTRAYDDLLPKRLAKWLEEDMVRGSYHRLGIHERATTAYRQRVAGRTDEELGQGYLADDVIWFAQQQGCSPEDWNRRWIIQHDSTYWIWHGGKYSPPIHHGPGGSFIYKACEDLLAPANLDWTKTNEDGKLKRKTVVEFLQKYASAAIRVESCLHLPQSRFDGYTFYEAVSPVRDDLDHLFVPEINAWLNLLAVKNDLDSLLDWVATITILDRQTSALYLCGEKDVGKSLFVQGLSKLWAKVGGATELATVIGSFNESLTRCPLVYADEKLPQVKGLSTFLRAFLGNSVRTLTRKYQDASNLMGCPRLILTGNNDRMLVDKGEELNQADLRATAERFLFIEAQSVAGDYLRSLGGVSGGTKEWVDGDLIARHALWLRDTRKVKPGSRFLVEGRETAMHRMIGGGFGRMEEVKQWLVRYVLQPNLCRGVGRNALIGNGVYRVTTSAVVENWQHYCHSAVPSMQAIGRDLKNCATRSIRGRFNDVRYRYHDINVDHLIEWAESYHVADGETLRKKINKPDSSWTTDGEIET